VFHYYPAKARNGLRGYVAEAVASSTSTGFLPPRKATQPMPFDNDLQYGKEGEKQLVRLLEDNGFGVITVAPDKKFDSWDIKTELGTVEVKRERLGLKTGNAFIEYQDADKNTGLLTTKSDYYAIIFDKCVFLCRTEYLKEFIRNEWSKLEKKKSSGDHKSVKGVLIPRKYLEGSYIIGMKYWLIK
jgi:hypothetical protein